MTLPLTNFIPDLAPLLQMLRERRDFYLIGVAGIPGSGKSTISAVLESEVDGARVLPMDGYHLPRSVLDGEGLRRRGAPHTFDAMGLRRGLERLRVERRGLFPAFDHAEKDPRADAIRIHEDASVVIVEGLYLLLDSWRMSELFDFTVFIDCPLDTAMERVAKRHVACGLCETIEAAWQRVETNDRLNALHILEDRCRERANLVLQT